MASAADNLAAELARQLGRMRWTAQRASGSPAYRFAPSSQPQPNERVGLRQIWHPAFATSVYDRVFLGAGVSLTGYWLASTSQRPSLYWPTPDAMAAAIRRANPSLTGYGPDEWLASFGGSPEPAAECRFAHIFWWFTKQGQTEWAVGAFRTWRASRQAVMGDVAEPEIDGNMTQAVMSQPLRSYERGVKANDQSAIKVDDLDWYLAGMKPLLDKMRATLGKTIVPDFALRAYGDCMRSGGDLFCQEAPGPYLMSWVMAAKYFANLTIPGNLAEQWAWAAWDVFYKSNVAGFTSTSIDSAIVNSILTAFTVTAERMLDRINTETADIQNLGLAALYADGQHELFNTARTQARAAAMRVRAVTDFVASALPSVQASGNTMALRLLTQAQQNATAAEASVNQFDPQSAVIYAANAYTYANQAAEAAGEAVSDEARKKLSLAKASTALKYLVVGGLGLAAVVVAWMLGKK